MSVSLQSERSFLSLELASTEQIVRALEENPDTHTLNVRRSEAGDREAAPLMEFLSSTRRREMGLRRRARRGR